MPTGFAASRQASSAPRVSAIASLDRLIGIGGGAERGLSRVQWPGQFAPQHLDEVGLDEDHRGEVVVGVELELGLIAAGEAVVAAVRAAPVAVEGPLEGHAVDPVERRAAADFLVGSLVGAADGVGQGADAAFFHQARDVPRGRPERLEVVEERSLFHEKPTNIGVLIISPNFRQSSGDCCRAGNWW